VPTDLAERQSDLASTWLHTCAFWGPGIVLIAIAGNFGWWGRTGAATAGLLWLAAMCLWNAARCRRLHCVITGPFFLLMALIVVLAGFRIVSFGAQTWNVINCAIVIGGVVLWCVPELIWGRYLGSASAAR
jgi:hypothetical protein